MMEEALMRRFTCLSVAGYALLLTMPLIAAGGEKKPAPLNTTLRARFEKGTHITGQTTQATLVLDFYPDTDDEQSFENTEYRYLLLNQQGMQLRTSVANTPPRRTVTFKDRKSS